MACRRCASDNQSEFIAEMSVHLLGLEDLDDAPVLVFPKLLACLQCGFTEFSLPEAERQLLARRIAVVVASTKNESPSL